MPLGRSSFGALALLTLAGASGCAGASSGTIAAALLNTTVGIGASGVRRATGDCYTPCVPGTQCNRATGYCEPLPCRDQCGPGEMCEVIGRNQRCVRVPTADLQIGRTAGEPPPLPPAPAPPPGP